MYRTHSTEPSTSGTAHLWEVGDTRGSVTLSALHCRDNALVGLVADVPSLASRATPTESGFWVFDVVQSHQEPGTGWGCSRHGGDCDMGAIVSQIAEPLWARLTAVGVTDGAVFAELERLLADERAEEAA